MELLHSDIVFRRVTTTTTTTTTATTAADGAGVALTCHYYHQLNCDLCFGNGVIVTCRENL